MSRRSQPPCPLRASREVACVLAAVAQSLRAARALRRLGVRALECQQGAKVCSGRHTFKGWSDWSL